MKTLPQDIDDDAEEEANRQYYENRQRRRAEMLPFIDWVWIILIVLLLAALATQSW